MPVPAHSRDILAADLRSIMGRDLPWERLADQRVIVSGAAGFLGSWILRTLVAAGSRPVALVRSTERARARLSDIAPAIEFMEWDLNRIAVPELGRADYIIHAASQASPRFYANDPVGTLFPNTVGTAALLQAAGTAKGFLFVSSSEIYGNASGKNALQENDGSHVDPASVRACYAESKRLGETLCVAWHAQHSLPTYIVRPFHTYGPGLTREDGRVFADFAYAAADGRSIVMTSDGSARRAFCYASDAVAGLFTVLLKGEPATPYNLANPGAELSVKQLADLIVNLYPERGARVVHRPPTDGYLPSSVNRLLPDISRLQRLGWQPHVGAEEGFRRLIEFISS